VDSHPKGRAARRATKDRSIGDALDPLPRTRFLASARTRILAAYLVLLVFSLGAGFIALSEILTSRARERVDDAVVQEGEEFRRLIRDGRDPRTGRPFGQDIERIFDVFLSRNVPGEGEAFLTFIGDKLYRASYSPRMRSRPVERIPKLGDIDRAVRGDVGIKGEEGSRVRYLALPVRLDGRRRGAFVVTVDLQGELDEVSDALRVAAAVLIGVLLLSSLLAWTLTGRVLAPIRRLAETARFIGESNLRRRILVQGHDEIAELARTFNAMLDRLEAAFDRLETAFSSQKDFITDAGHELRTPITIIRGHIELLGDDPIERRQTVEVVTDELARMSRFVDDLLLLAKSQRPDFLQYEQLELDALTGELFAKASALAPRTWRLEAADDARFTGDRQRLTQAMMNLSQNAVQHTREGDPIALGGELVNGSVRLWVRDTGPGVPPEDRKRIFERFVRGDGRPVRAEGAGLGLAIVRAIVEAHGGRVELDSPACAGATFTVVIPREPPRRRRPGEPDPDRTEGVHEDERTLGRPALAGGRAR
jgi:signal transduction histidine kinase